MHLTSRRNMRGREKSSEAKHALNGYGRHFTSIHPKLQLKNEA